MSAKKSAPTRTQTASPRQVRRTLAGQLPFSSQSLTLGVRVAIVMYIVALICGTGLWVASYFDIEYPFSYISTRPLNGIFQGASACFSGGIFGPEHTISFIFLTGTLLVYIAARIVSSRYLSRHRLPQLRDFLAAPIIAGLLCGIIGAIGSAFGYVHGTGPSGSRVFFIAFLIAFAAVIRSFCVSSSHYRTFFWRHMGHVHRVINPALHSFILFCVLGIIVSAVSVGVYTWMNAPETFVAPSFEALGMGVGHLLLLLPLLFAGASITISGNGFGEWKADSFSLYSDLGMPWTIVISVALVVVLLIVGIRLSIARRGIHESGSFLATVATYFLLAAVFYMSASIYHDGHWALRISGTCLSFLLLWGIVIHIIARYIAPVIISALPFLSRRHSDVIDHTMNPDPSHIEQ